MNKKRSTQAAAKVLSAVLTASVFLAGAGITALADSAGTVTVDNAKVRSDASTDSSTVSTLANGTQVTVTDEKSDSSGNVWYHVTLSDGKTGYVRSDLMSVTAIEETASTDTPGDTGNASADTATDTGGIDISVIVNPEGVTAQDLQNATINVATGKVRSDASTNDDIVAQLNQGTNVVISGSKLGSDSKTWYYVTFLDGGSQKNGYVRSDLVDIGDVIIMSAPETEAAEEPADTEAAEEPVVNNDYELVYTDDGTGQNVWWLYNHIDNNREKLQELLDYADSQGAKTAALTSTNQKLKIVSIVLGALLAIALVAVIILAVKLNSAGYEYEDDDEDDDEDDEEPVSRRDRRRSARFDDDEDDDDDEEVSASRRRKEREASRGRDRERERVRTSERRTVSADEDDDSDVRTDAPVKKNKPKNFMLDDDEFEFEFLNMDEK